MAIQPVDITKAYRLLQLGSTTMISAKHENDADVMAFAKSVLKNLRWTIVHASACKQQEA